MIEDWIDAVCQIAGTVPVAGKGQVKSHWAFKKSEFPETLNDLPEAISYVTGVRLMGGSDSGPTFCYWRGVTEFHLCPSTAKQFYPSVLPYYGRIVKVFLSKRTLGGLVTEFSLIKDPDGEAISAGNLDYGTGEAGVKHLGLIVYWRVKEQVKGLVLGN